MKKYVSTILLVIVACLLVFSTSEKPAGASRSNYLFNASMSFTSNNPAFYVAWNCNTNAYEFTYGYDPNTTCADDTVPWPNQEYIVYSMFTPRESVRLTATASRSTYNAYQYLNIDIPGNYFTGYPNPHADVAYGMAPYFFPNIVSHLWSNILSSSDIRTYVDYCANTVGWGYSTTFHMHTSEYFQYEPGSDCCSGSTNGIGPDLYVTLICEY